MQSGQAKRSQDELGSLLALYPSSSSTDEPVMPNIQEYGSSEGFANSRHSDSVASLELLVPSRVQVEFPQTRRVALEVYRFGRKRGFLPLGLIVVMIGLYWMMRPSYGEGPIDITVSGEPLAFSKLDPVEDLGLYNFIRDPDTAPSNRCLRASPEEALPTNAWYQNLLLAHGEPSETQRVYTIPYILDVVGLIPGLRVHPIHIDGTQTVIQISTIAPHSLTLGVAGSAGKAPSGAKTMSKHYSVLSSTPLGITLKWDTFPMTSSLVRGMPYATMHFSKTFVASSDTLLPTLASEIALLDNPVVDGEEKMLCSRQGQKTTRVERELKMTFEDSDFTWLVFFSEPVWVQCIEQPQDYGPAQVLVQVTDTARQGADVLTVRVALLTSCTTGKNPLHCNQWDSTNKEASLTQQEYEELLRQHAAEFPGPDGDVRYVIDGKNDEAVITFDWDAQSVASSNGSSPSDILQSKLRQKNRDNVSEDASELIMFALPHHLDTLDESLLAGKSRYCVSSLLGPTCLVKGSVWKLKEQLPATSFRAARPPRPEALKPLADSLLHDIKFRLPEYYRRGAGDTYFSGKMLAKAGRILLIADELMELCRTGPGSQYSEEYDSRIARHYENECNDLSLPTKAEFQAMLNSLQQSVEIWLNGKADIPFIYDSGWGGVISCGCFFDDQTNSCSNQFPNCPTASDPGLNFGNGFYNYHHFHYGYHIYAAAVVASFDPSWGRRHFEQILLLVRDIANPSREDIHFPRFRQKDWYQGHSWANGIALPHPNGRNQESSSEAIASYEAVSLFGSVMINAWRDQRMVEKVLIATEIRNVGRLLAATELRSADRYWHVRQVEKSKSLVPATFRESVVGIMWSTMAQFQTWFGSAPYLPYGIQLLPLTPVAEARDDPDWLREIYKPYAEACGADPVCEQQGWSVLQIAVLASVGHVDNALKNALRLPTAVFESAGGNGHSLTNTLWYIATRPHREPLDLAKSGSSSQVEQSAEGVTTIDHVDCGIPESCTDKVLDMAAGGHSCRDRITFLMSSFSMSEEAACFKVGGREYPEECGACNPGDEYDLGSGSSCQPCTMEQCQSDLNRCPLYERTFVCTGGAATGGCSPVPWELKSGPCGQCCELTNCVGKSSAESEKNMQEMNKEEEIQVSHCGRCSAKVCNSRLNLCPVQQAPFLCTRGVNLGGCSPRPWDIVGRECLECCKLTPGCKDDA